jgi:hypothetical protein
MNEFAKSILLTLLLIAVNAGTLAVAWWLLGSTNLDIPSIGGVYEYLLAAGALWLLGSVATTDARIEQVKSRNR